MYLLLSTYKVAIEEVERVTPAHRDFLSRRYEAGKLLASGLKVAPNGWSYSGTRKNPGGTDQLIAEDPFHKEKIADYDIVEFKAVKFHSVLKDLGIE